MKARPLPSREELLANFFYDPESGNLYWKTAGAGRKIGDLAGYKGKTFGYRVTLKRRPWRSARIIWKMLHDEEPQDVDHRDLDPLNNRVWNLRASTHLQNCYNKRVYSNNTTGIKGVTLTKSGSYRVRIAANGRRHWICRHSRRTDIRIGRQLPFRLRHTPNSHRRWQILRLRPQHLFPLVSSSLSGR
jgi:hypothetical protein